MNDEHRRILNDEREFLLKRVNFQRLKPLLLKYKILNENMWKDVVSMESLLDALPHWSSKALHDIIEILREAGYVEEADVLENCETKFYYKLTSKPLGYCLMINNVIFEPRKKSTSTTVEDENRYGSEADVKSLSCFFEKAGFKVIVEQNMKADEMADYLKNFAKRKDLANVDSMIVIIMSHGAEINSVDIIFGTDWDYIMKADIRDYFNNENCKLLQNKPKVFIFISCRGKGMDYGVYCESVDSGCNRSMEYDILKDLPNSVSFDARGTILKSTITETFFVHSALPCQMSQRHHENGTIFCQALIEVLNKNYKIHDLHTIINFVNRKLVGKISPTFHTIQSAHYESIGATKSFKFCGS